jgi:hypothetical protein
MPKLTKNNPIIKPQNPNLKIKTLNRLQKTPTNHLIRQQADLTNPTPKIILTKIEQIAYIKIKLNKIIRLPN